ncbi:hypothetical protein [Actinomadura bangladeshensis]|uniref:Uncharacterized protein n=1 Tax=Actinomadura bangladeshensis TaxID=453573 RepID=A0A4R4P610_9ACTN|nr:hypothetical protein [Actinomadura bangladeshensis]TDC16230.1 hypothetical protein E1284_13385 [Actinomadura bangladeshensis]
MLDDAALERSSIVANCAMNRERTLKGYVRELGVHVLAEAGRRLTASLCRAGFAYDPRRRRISLRGHRKIELPYHYIGADDRAGPNYTGQPAVDSFYTPA